MGVTLYALVAGHLPWNDSDGRPIHEIVRNEPLVFPSHRMSPDMRDLIGRMLNKVPESRITISKMKQHSWLTNNATEPLPSETDNCRVPVTVTEEEVIRLGTLLMVKNMLKQHSFQVSASCIFDPKNSKRSKKTILTLHYNERTKEKCRRIFEDTTMNVFTFYHNDFLIRKYK